MIGVVLVYVGLITAQPTTPLDVALRVWERDGYPYTVAVCDGWRRTRDPHQLDDNLREAERPLIHLIDVSMTAGTVPHQMMDLVSAGLQLRGTPSTQACDRYDIAATALSMWVVNTISH